MSPRTAAKRAAQRLLGPPTIRETDIVYDLMGNRVGTMLDVGAHFGTSLAPFAEAGWSVHAFEPDPVNRERLISGHGKQSNVVIIPAAVSDAPGELPLYASPESTGISSLAAFTESHEQTATVQVLTLREYLAEHDITSVDFIKIDVEGYERHVLDGYDWSVRPSAIVLEFEDDKTRPLGYDWTHLADELSSKGYAVVVSEWFPIERYGVSHRWRRFADYPTVLADENGWGNLIAVTPDRVGDLHRLLSRTERRYRLRTQVDRLRGAAS